MSKTNTYLAQQAAVVENPITFTTTAGAANTGAMATIVDANVQLILDLISLEGTDPSVKRGYLDEMSPACRVTLYKVLTDLKLLTLA